MHIFLLIALVAAIEEPEPINEQERNDEVAQSQMRAGWIACLYLARNRILQDNSEISEIATSVSKEAKALQKKIAASSLYKCSLAINAKQAEEILRTENIDWGDESISRLVDTDYQKFKTLDWKYTDEEKGLIDKIEYVKVM